MTDRDAQEIVRMIESNWGIDLGPARAMWRAELLPHDATTGMNAVAHLAKNLRWKPKLIDLRDAISIMKRKDQEVVDMEARRQQKALEAGPRLQTPEWVYVWAWARNSREPIEERALPQMGTWADPHNTMTTSDYEALHAEWVAAGMPHDKVTARVAKSM